MLLGDEKLEMHDMDDPFTDAVTRPDLGMLPETPLKSLCNVGDTILATGLVGTTKKAFKVRRSRQLNKVTEATK